MANPDRGARENAEEGRQRNAERPSPADRGRRGGQPAEPVERAVTEPPEKRG